MAQFHIYVHVYYISDAILVSFEGIKMVCSLGKIFLSDEEIISFERYNTPCRTKNWDKRRNVTE